MRIGVSGYQSLSRVQITCDVLNSYRPHKHILATAVSYRSIAQSLAPLMTMKLLNQKQKKKTDGACAHCVMVSKFQWKPFWLATQRDPQNDWTAIQNRVNYDVFAQAPLYANRRFRKRWQWPPILKFSGDYPRRDGSSELCCSRKKVVEPMGKTSLVLDMVDVQEHDTA